MAKTNPSGNIRSIGVMALFLFLFRIMSDSLLLREWIPITILAEFFVGTFEKKIDRRIYSLLIIFVLLIQCLLVTYTFIIAEEFNLPIFMAYLTLFVSFSMYYLRGVIFKRDE